MDLDEYLWRNKITSKSVGDASGISLPAIKEYKYRRITPNLFRALQLQIVTKGNVPLEEFLSIEDKKRFDEWLQENKENSDKCLPGYKKRK